MISGKLMGNCECNIVEILPQGRIDGEIMAKELIIEKGGEFVGNSVTHKENHYKNAYEAGQIGSTKKLELKDDKKV